MIIVIELRQWLLEGKATTEAKNIRKQKKKGKKTP
jgi:hypothetical protein